MRKLFLFFLFISSFLISYSSDSIPDEINNKIQSFYKNLGNCNSRSYLIANKDVVQYTKTPEEQNSSSDFLYEIRIKELNKTTPIKLEYNSQVKRFIEIYIGRRNKEFEKILGLTALYFPIFEEKLDKYNLPLELKYLSVVESSLNPLAVSPSGAVGLWQFLYNTSSMFDLEINSYIDERRDPIISTDAACRYFSYLYNIFNDWQLAIASFNGGPGEIRNAIERSGGKTDYWELQPYLSNQTKSFVPAFIASVYVLNYAHEHGLVVKEAKYNFFNTDTLKIKKQITFDQICSEIDISKDEIRFLNPVYKMDLIPEIKNNATLVLPSEKIVQFLQKENKIYATQPVKKDYWSQLETTGDTIGKVKLMHKVKKGEFFHKIALNYRCTINDIKKWNNLESDYLYPGQELFIWVPEDEAHLFINIENISQQDGYIVYTVQEGDTIWSIAEKFNIKSIDELKNINDNLDENNIKPGQKIKINW